MSTPSTGSSDTPARLLAAAERLIVERGIESVSMREVGREAGSRNVIASQYWFKDRDGLIRAILDKHRADVESRRHALLDAYQAAGVADIARLAEALVRPLGAKLDQGVSGAGYLRVLSDLVTRTNPSVEPFDPDNPTSSMLRWRDLVEPLLDPDAVAMHRRFLAARFVIIELALRARLTRGDHRLFLAHLVDLTAGLLTAAVSEETRRLRGEPTGGGR